jgi:protein gp37
MADVFEDRSDVATERPKLWALIERTPSLDWLLLTKRPQNINRMVPTSWWAQPRSNVWYGTTVESPDYLWRVAYLRDTSAAVRFVSYEPALADVQWPLDGIHWLIAGGESGAQARPVEADWMRSARDQAVAAGVAFLFKQWGGRTPKSGGRLLDGRTWDEMPGLAA